MRLHERSLGWQNDLIGLRPEARLGENADCIAVCSEHNPTLYWGNCLLLPAAPTDDELAHGLARFQHVSTHPAWRRQGLCTARVQGVSSWGHHHRRLARAVWCADPHGVAIGIYRALGDQPVGTHWALQRIAPHDRLAADTPLAPPTPPTPPAESRTA